ncbi:hypothetical protein SDC9_114120 [bioreactor metagenome]|uniref:Uncharacterized protein n=1 Tax=bioreactor metagenome TaxID=1076179 RepID=A0A645BVF7_9ZZZZ
MLLMGILFLNLVLDVLRDQMQVLMEQELP